MARFALMNPEDNVAVALEPAAAGDTVTLPDGRELRALDAIPFAHKIALASIQVGSEVRKYGEIIGEATQPIEVGRHVHVHNIKSRRA